LALLLAILVASCGPGLARSPDTAVPAAPDAVGTLQPVTVGPDTVLPLPGGATAFATIRSLLAQARRTIHLEMYEFQRHDLAALVTQSRARGVAVTAIMDPSERGSRSVWATLEAGGARVVAFPIEPQSIDHVKLLVVDGERAIVGGINWGRTSERNRDYDVLVWGPVVENLERVFDQDLALAGVPVVLPAPRTDASIRVLVTRPAEALRAAVLDALAAARHTVDVEMFVLSDRQVLEALTAAARRGVLVRVLLDPGQPQNAAALAELRRAGARARAFRPRAGEKLHAKAGIFDGATLIFGSCNWSRSGFTRNHELDLLITDPTVAQMFLAQLDADWVASAG